MTAAGRGQRLLDFILLACHDRLILDHQVNLVLQHNDVLKSHDVHSDQMLSSLRLRVRLIAGDEQKSGVHDRSARQHCRHEGVVPRAVNEGDVAGQNERRVTQGAIRGVGLVRAERFEAVGRLAVDALVELGVRVAKLDRDVPQFLPEQSHCLR